MSAQTLHLWRIDRWDGGERQNPTNFYLREKADASIFKNQNPHDDVVPVTLILLGSLADFSEAEIELKRQRALAKLTEEERELLGLA